MHFRMLHVASRDFDHQISKLDLMFRCKRATPLQWVRFLTSSKVIKITRSKEPPDLYNSLISTLYSKPCKPDIGYFFDNSKWKPGLQILKNHLEFWKRPARLGLIKVRKPLLGRFFEATKSAIGRQSLENRLEFFKGFEIPWICKQIWQSNKNIYEEITFHIQHKLIFIVQKIFFCWVPFL